MQPCHFYLTFNPLFNPQSEHKSQAHEFYHALKSKNHLYWGKIQLTQHSESLNLNHYQEVISQNSQNGIATCLFISDYENVWVARVESVTTDRPQTSETLPFYDDKKIEMWFKIIDFDLVSHDTAETTQIIQSFFVDHKYYSYKLKSITRETSGIRFPMIIQSASQQSFFSETKRNQGYNELLARPTVKKTFVIPEYNFKRLPLEVQTKILHAEVLLLEAQGQGKRDRPKLEEAILTYLRCLELVLNATVVSQLRAVEGHRLFVTTETPKRFLRSPLDRDKKQLIRLKDFTDTIDLNQIKMIMDAPSFFHNTSMDYVFRNKRRFWEYCRLELRSTLKNEALLEIKNSLEQNKSIDFNDRELVMVRNILLGVGGKGIFNDLVEAYFESSRPAQVVA